MPSNNDNIASWSAGKMGSPKERRGTQMLWVAALSQFCLEPAMALRSILVKKGEGEMRLNLLNTHYGPGPLGTPARISTSTLQARHLPRSPLSIYKWSQVKACRAEWQRWAPTQTLWLLRSLHTTVWMTQDNLPIAGLEAKREEKDPKYYLVR